MYRRWLIILTAFVLAVSFATVTWAQDGVERLGGANIYVPMVMIPTSDGAAPTPTDSPTGGGAATSTPTVTPRTDGTPWPPTVTSTPTPTGSPVPPTITPTPTATEETTWHGACEYLGGDSAPSGRFGVQMYSNTEPDSQYFDALVDSNAGWVRVNAAWSSVEPQDTIPFYFDWTGMDRELAAASHLRVKVIGTIKLAPLWATSGIDRPNGPIDSENLGDFVDFVKALVERYDGDGVDDAPCKPVINHWQLYNEADRIGHGGYRGGWGDDPEAYAEMLRLVYPEIKRANPNARVIFTGLAYEWFQENDDGPFVREFTARVLAAGGGDYFDIMSFHVYPEFWSVRAQQPPGLIEKAEEIRNILATYGVSKPMMITETGTDSGTGELKGPEQARYVHQLLAQSLVAGAESAIWFMLHDLQSYGYLNGLVTIDGIDKTAMMAYRLAVRMFERADYVRTLSLSERGRNDLLAYEFRNVDSGSRFYIAWLNPVGTLEVTTLRLPGEAVKIRTTYTDYTLYDGSDGVDDGTITVNVGAEPVYVEILAQQGR